MDDKEWEEMVWRVCKKKKAKFLAEHSDFINGLDETEKKLFEETWHKRVQFVVIAKGSTRRIFELNLEKPIAPQICYGAMDRIRRRRWLECEKAKAVQEKVLELAAKGAALDVAKKTDASKPTKKKTRRGRQGSGLKGKKTEHMDEQLSEFKTWILDNHPVNESKYGCSVGERAKQFWNKHNKTFNKDKKRQGEKRGYACPKALAAAYRTSVRRNRKR